MRCRFGGINIPRQRSHEQHHTQQGQEETALESPVPAAAEFLVPWTSKGTRHEPIGKTRQSAWQ